MIDWPNMPSGEHRLPCLLCARHERDRTFGVTVEPGRGVGHCFRCGHVETWHDGRVRRVPGKAPAAPVAASKRETLSEYGRDLWNGARPLSGAALAYLEARACVIPPVDGALRWHPALRHPPSGLELPALLALVTHAETGEPMTLHRTWVQADGTKAPLDPPRLLLGGHRKAGGVIRLWPDEAVTTGLGVAEGIETALSLAHAGLPCWACIDAGNLQSLPLLRGIEALTIAADNDPAGLDAAERLGQRWANDGRQVRIVAAAGARADLNDLARAS